MTIPIENVQIFIWTHNAKSNNYQTDLPSIDFLTRTNFRRTMQKNPAQSFLPFAREKPITRQSTSFFLCHCIQVLYFCSRSQSWFALLTNLLVGGETFETSTHSSWKTGFCFNHLNIVNLTIRINFPSRIMTVDHQLLNCFRAKHSSAKIALELDSERDR